MVVAYKMLLKERDFISFILVSRAALDHVLVASKGTVDVPVSPSLSNTDQGSTDIPILYLPGH